MNRPGPAGQPTNRTPIFVIVGVLAVAVVLAVVALLVSGGDDGDVATDGATTTVADGGTGTTAEPAPDGPVEETAEPVSVSGDPLPSYEAGGTVAEDPAVGLPFPELEGTGIDGRPLRIGPGGGPMAVVFLAHWCPACQAEVPVLVDVIDDGAVPDGVEVIGVATDIDERRPNWPPSEWLEGEGWQQPTLLDLDSGAATAVGLTSFPYFVLVSEDGTVAARAAGQLTPEALAQLFALIEP
jgi:thiol-disulfide isomerase/thioredoxin